MAEDILSCNVTIGRSLSFIVIAAYIPPTKKIEKFNQIDIILRRIKKEYSRIRVILAGDLNTEYPFDTHHRMLQPIMRDHFPGLTEGVFVTPTRIVRNHASRIDYILDNEAVTEETVVKLPFLECSDHCCLLREVKLTYEAKNNYAVRRVAEKVQELNERIYREPLDRFLESVALERDNNRNQIYQKKKIRSFNEWASCELFDGTPRWEKVKEFLNNGLKKPSKKEGTYRVLKGLIHELLDEEREVTELALDDGTSTNSKTRIEREIARWYADAHTGRVTDDNTLITDEEFITRAGNFASEKNLRKAAALIRLGKAGADEFLNDELVKWILQDDETNENAKSNFGAKIKTNAQTLARWLNTMNLEKTDTLRQLISGRLAPIRKTAEHPTPLDKIRPVVCPSILYKLLENMIKPAFRKVQKHCLSKAQTGFIEGLSTTTNTRRLFRKIKQAQEQLKPLFVLFIDFKSAYDNVRRSKIREIIERLTTQSLLSISQSAWTLWLIENFSVTFKETSIEISKGVPQGGVLSPCLFNLVIDELARELEKEEGELLLYADDLCFLSENQSTLRTVITQTKNWSIEQGIPINFEKSGVMEIRGTRIRTRTLNTSELEGVPVVERYRFLGVELSAQGRIENALISAKTILMPVCWGLRTLKGSLTLSVVLRVFNTLTMPRRTGLLQVHDLISTGEREKTEILERDLLRTALGIRSGVPRAWLTCLLGGDAMTRLERIRRHVEGRKRTLAEKAAEEGGTTGRLARRRMTELVARVGWTLVGIWNVTGMMCPTHGERCDEGHLQRYHRMPATFETVLLEGGTKMARWERWAGTVRLW